MLLMDFFDFYSYVSIKKGLNFKFSPFYKINISNNISLNNKKPETQKPETA